MRANRIKAGGAPARKIMIAVASVMILAVVNAGMLMNMPALENSRRSLFLGLFGLHIALAGGMLIWAAHVFSEWKHHKYHAALHRGFQEALLPARDQDEVVDLLFGFVRLCIPARGGAFFMQSLSDDSRLSGKREWFKDNEDAFSQHEIHIEPCEVCDFEQSKHPKPPGHGPSRKGHKEQPKQPQVLCRWIPSGDRKLARICLQLRAGYQLSDIQADTLNWFVLAALPALHRAKQRAASSLTAVSGKTDRIHLAHYLHDTLVNDLAILHAKINQIQTLIPSKEGAYVQSELDLIGRIAHKSYRQVRDELFRLRETSPADLIFALSQTIDQVRNRTNLDINSIMGEQTQALSAQESRNVLYIVREALRNVEKHAGADRVDVSLTWNPESLNIRIADNGRGFSPQSAMKNEDHFGLKIVYQCAMEMNAEVNIDSAVDRGTQITLTLPL